MEKKISSILCWVKHDWGAPMHPKFGRRCMRCGKKTKEKSFDWVRRLLGEDKPVPPTNEKFKNHSDSPIGEAFDQDPTV